MARLEPKSSQAAKAVAGTASKGHGKKIYSHDSNDESVAIFAKASKGIKLKIVPSDPHYKMLEVWPQTKGKNRKKLAEFCVYTTRRAKSREQIAFGSLKVRKAKPSAYEPNARARAILRGVDIAEADLANSGGSFELADVQRAMRGVSRQSIEKRVREKSLLAIPGPSNRRRYPTIQFNDDGTVVPGLKEVLNALNFESAWASLNYLVNPDDRLNQRRPIDLLRRGEVALVLESAKRVGEQGA